MLDSDVDEGGCRTALQNAGQDVLTARAAHVDDQDRDVMVYALDEGAVVLTRDGDYTTKGQKHHPLGTHIRLRCPNPAEYSVLAMALPELVHLLESTSELLTIEVSATLIKFWRSGGRKPEKIPLPSKRRLGQPGSKAVRSSRKHRRVLERKGRRSRRE